MAVQRILPFNIRQALAFPAALEVHQLPTIVRRPMAAHFGACDAKTLKRAEEKGLLHPVRRGFRGVGYHRDELLGFFRIEPEHEQEEQEQGRPKELGEKSRKGEGSNGNGHSEPMGSKANTYVDRSASGALR
jgi:hypothetical protein